MLATVYFIINHKDSVGLKEGLATVQPLSADNCLYCNGPLDSEKFCRACQVRRETVEK